MHKTIDKYIGTRYNKSNDILARDIKGGLKLNENIVLTESTYYILLSLYKPQHGYGIMQQTEQAHNSSSIHIGFFLS